jgi:hypothetical protein
VIETGTPSEALEIAGLHSFAELTEYAIQEGLTSLD